MKKHIILTALATLLPAASAFDNTIWTFENSLNSETGSGLHSAANVKYGKFVTTTTTNEDGSTSETTTWQESTATYTESNMTVGTTVGNRQLTQDLGKAITLSDNAAIKVGDAYWSNLSGALNHSNYTLMAWIKLDNTNGTKSIFGTGDSGSNGIKFDIKGNKISLTYKSVSEYVDSSSITLSAGTWYNVAVAVNSTTNTATYYLNGDQLSTVNLRASGANNPGGAGAAIGSGCKDNKQDLFSGQIAEFQILSGTMNQAEILTAAHLTPEPATATLSILALAGLMARRRRKG